MGRSCGSGSRAERFEILLHASTDECVPGALLVSDDGEKARRREEPHDRWVAPRGAGLTDRAITDDKQMTLFTAEALLQATDRFSQLEIWMSDLADDCGLTHPARDPQLMTACPV